MLTALLLSRWVTHPISERFDRALVERAHTLAALCELDDGVLEFSFAGREMPEFDTGGDQYFQLWDEQGREVSRSPSLGDSFLDHARLDEGRSSFENTPLPDGREGRLVHLAFRPRMDEELLDEEDEPDPEEQAWLESAEEHTPPLVQLRLAIERESLDAELLRLRVTIWASLAFALLVLLWITTRLVERGLRPLGALAEEVGRIQADTLSSPLNSPAAGIEELAPIEAALNRSLAGLAEAFRREREFSANVAHELRTPLAELRSLCEVAPMVEADREALLGFFRDTERITLRMERAVIALLELARLENGQEEPLRQAIDPVRLLEEALRRAASGPNAGRVQLPRAEGLEILADAMILERLLANLLGNALSHSPEETPVQVEVEREQATLAICITNEAPALEQEDMRHLCRRFWRKDESRTGDQHAGLGLALVKHWSDLLGLELAFTLLAGKLRVRLSGLPLSS